MKRILPFKALKYNKNVVGDLGMVVAPAYDSISKEQQQKLYSGHPFNVVRLEFGAVTDEDSGTDNRYSRSAETLQEWMYSGVLIPDRQPAIYVYGQDYDTPDGERLNYKGIVCLVRLDDYEEGTILPHEEILPKSKSDRFNLMTACGVNFSPVFSLYDDNTKEVTEVINKTVEAAPELTVKTADDSIIKLWAVSEEETISRIGDVLKDKLLFIADGHSRYEAALAYRDAIKETNPDHVGDEPYNYVMMFLGDMNDMGLTLFPVHRLVNNVVGFNEQAIVAQLEENFTVEKIFDQDIVTDAKTRLEDNTETSEIVMYTGKDYYYSLKIKESYIEGITEEEKSEAFIKQFDVNLLHELILNKILGIAETELKSQKYISYTYDIYDAVEKVKDGECQCSFMLSPMKQDDVLETALAGEKLPQKSTYFCPKLVTGLVMNNLNL